MTTGGVRLIVLIRIGDLFACDFLNMELNVDEYIQILSDERKFVYVDWRNGQIVIESLVILIVWQFIRWTSVLV